MEKQPLLHKHPAKVQASLHICAVSPKPILFTQVEGQPKKASARELDMASG